MPQDHIQPLRNWREVASEIEEEPDLEKVTELANELIRLLDAESMKRFGQTAGSS